MIYVYFGDNNVKRHNACDKIVEAYLKKEYTVISMNDVDVDVSVLNDYMTTSSLFDAKHVVVLERGLENVEASEYIFSHLKELKESENVLVISERSLLKDPLTKLKKVAEDVEQFETPVSKYGKKEFNVFGLTDAFGMRDKKESWVHIAKAWRNGKSAEELHGILFWQVKNMLLIKKSGGISATTLGLNPFVHKKAEAAAKKFTEEELEAMSSKLASVLYESRRQGSDSQIALEQFVLSVL